MVTHSNAARPIFAGWKPLHHCHPIARASIEGIDRFGHPAFTNRIAMIFGHDSTADIFPSRIPRSWHWSMFAKSSLTDENGEEWESGLGSSYSGGQRRTVGGVSLWRATVMDLKGISIWGFSCFPRRGAELRFRLYTNTLELGWVSIMDFTLPNPYRGVYPRWQASPLPAVARTNELVASLVSISCGPSGPGLGQVIHLPNQPTYFSNPRKWSTVFKLQLLENGEPSSQWLPQTFHALDATGNEWTSELETDHEAAGVWTAIVTGKVFSPSEVWRMSFTFVRENSPDPLRHLDSCTFDFLVQPPTNPPTFKTPFPASSK